MNILTLISRLFVGLLFIFSGFIKANDPIGFSYKLAEYFEVFGMPALASIALPLAIMICVVEIVLGYNVLFGVEIKLTSWLLLLMILFFTWLTGYSAVTNRVTDCGCFGDAIKLKPVESFYKDLILLLFILVIFLRRNHIKPFFSRPFALKSAVLVTLMSAAFSIYCWYYLPAIDFLHWKEGANIREKMSIPPGAPRDSMVMVFVYEKGGKTFEFGLNDLPKDLETYTFKDRKDKLIREGYRPPIHDFSVSGPNGESYTDTLVNQDGYKLVLVSYDLGKYRIRAQKKLNILTSKWQDEARLPVWALTATPLDQAEKFRHELQAPYPFYSVDGTALKAMIRSNPGIILMKKSTVIKKWPATAVPTYEQVKKLML